MLELVGLLVDVVDVDTERLREIELEQPVVADHLEGDTLAVGRERDAPVRRMLGEPKCGELLHHRARRRGRHPLRACERGHADRLAALPELVDLP